jgi:RHH-type proline utilization regulon transcriptional repressor/proline dehydrogenase/delta 1-pyrroline-5-carboxylate dehydrogenase
MGEVLHDLLIAQGRGVSCRIYAPVGAHHDLLAYLVRRLLENGASGSFVNQIANPDIPVSSLARDPAAIVAGLGPGRIPLPNALYQPDRANSLGFDFGDPAALTEMDRALNAEPIGADDAWPLVGGVRRQGGTVRTIHNPADRGAIVGFAHEAGADDIEAALAAAVGAQPLWDGVAVEARAACLDRAADRIEADRAHLIALAIREAGKTLGAAVAEVREAVDLLRFYAVSRADRRDRSPELCRAGRGGLHLALELPAGDLHRTGGGRACRGQCGDRKAGRADAADRRACG